MLRNAGVSVQLQPANVDEDAIKQAMEAEEASARDIADALAEVKARKIAMKFPTGLVLGADQILTCDGKIYSKAPSLDDAKSVLNQLQGRAHELLSAAVIYENGQPVWRHVGRAQMMMRTMSDDFIAEYLQAAGPEILGSVGCYQLEALGAQLFNRVQGDYFTVLGLPLLEVLGFLRTRGLLST